MTMQNMFGVVLWSDAAAQKAVIWCEDQGELAFYTPSDRNMHDAPELDAGDLIQFDVFIQKNMRRATNPQLLTPSHSPDLPKNLRASHPDNDSRADAKLSTVVDMSSYRSPAPQNRVARVV